MPLMDEFYKGAELGLRVSDQRARHTNLAERAAQTNRALDIRERQTDADLSRLNLLNKQLDYDLTRQKDDDNEKTVQLNLLKDYAATLTAAANDPDFSEKLPMPPAGLYGQYHTQAVQSHSAYMKSRQDDLDYKRHVKSVENENDLLDNWGLPLNWQTSTNEIGQPNGQFLYLQATQRRAASRASAIADGLGVNFREAVAKGVHPFDHINPATGDLEEDSYRSSLRPFSPYRTASVTTHPTGARSETFITDEKVRSERAYATSKSAAASFARLKEQMIIKRADLLDPLKGGRTPEEADADILKLFPPEAIVDVPQPDGTTSQVPIYVGSQMTNNGVTYVYIGGGHQNEANWKRLN